MDPLYVKVYIIYMNLVVQGLIPLLILLLLNILIYIKLVAYARDSREAAQPRMMQLQHDKEVKLASVSLFIVLGETHNCFTSTFYPSSSICHLPRGEVGPECVGATSG